MVNSGSSGDEVAEGVAENDRGAVGEGVDHRGDVVRHVLEAHPGHRTGRASDAARLGPQHLVTGVNECRAEQVEVFTAVTAVGRDDDHRRAVSIDIGLDRRGAGADNFTAPVHGSSG